MENTASLFYLILSIILTILLFIFIFLVVAKHLNAAKRIETQLSKVTNGTSMIGLLLTTVSVFIAWSSFQASLKSPKIEVDFITGHNLSWAEENGDRHLNLSYDSTGRVDLGFGVPSWWHIQLKNIGNKGTSNLKVMVTFNGIKILHQPADYTVSNFHYSQGGYFTLEREINTPLSPSDTYSLPDFPWHLFITVSDDMSIGGVSGQDPDPVTMTVTIFEDSIKKSEQTYVINMEDYNENMGGTIAEHNDRLEMPITDSMGNYRFHPELKYINEFDFMDSYDAYAEPIKEMTGSKFAYAQRCYFYYLENVNAYNPAVANEARQKVVYFGRVYYRYKSERENLNYTMQDIETLVSNDIAPHL